MQKFFGRSGHILFQSLRKRHAVLLDEVDLLLEGVAPLQTAGPNEVSFLDNRRYVSALEQTLAGAVIVHPDMQARVPSDSVAL